MESADAAATAASVRQKRREAILARGDERLRIAKGEIAPSSQTSLTPDCATASAEYKPAEPAALSEHSPTPALLPVPTRVPSSLPAPTTSPALASESAPAHSQTMSPIRPNEMDPTAESAAAALPHPSVELDSSALTPETPSEGLRHRGAARAAVNEDIKTPLMPNTTATPSAAATAMSARAAADRRVATVLVLLRILFFAVPALLGVAGGLLWARCDEFWAALSHFSGDAVKSDSAAAALLAAHASVEIAAEALPSASLLLPPISSRLRSLCAAGSVTSWRPLLLLLLPALRFVLARQAGVVCRAVGLLPAGSSNLLATRRGAGGWLRAGVAFLRGVGRGNAALSAAAAALQALLDAASFAADAALDAAIFTVALVFAASWSYAGVGGGSA